MKGIEDSVVNNCYITLSMDIEADTSIRLLSVDVRIPSQYMIFPPKVIMKNFDNHFSMASM